MHFTFRISKSSLIIYLLLSNNEHYFSPVSLFVCGLHPGTHFSKAHEKFQSTDLTFNTRLGCSG